LSPVRVALRLALCVERFVHYKEGDHFPRIKGAPQRQVIAQP
jgi:hypothetical protein